MSEFIVSARKYRPGSFDEVVGQDHITQSLENAIKNDKVAHAYLFCGPRGVGKTTCARILAKVLNGDNSGNEESLNLNIFELDAASNNSVEDIRSLVEQVRFTPQQGKYKVYIIDEVHMLSQNAFNAFLKTLEEPPPHAIFILATTEKHKVIPTILSRCQIFDFRRVSVDRIVQHLKNIAEKEQISVSDEALHVIAQKADGSIRDSLSLFDRLVSISTDGLTYEMVLTNLNVLDYDYFFKVTDALLAEDAKTAMLILDEILHNGFEGDDFILGLGSHFRNLLMCQDSETLRLLEVSPNIRQKYEQQAASCSAGFLLSNLNLVNECDVNYRMAKNKRLLVELHLMKMCFVNRAIQANSGMTAEKKNAEPETLAASPPKKKAAENAEQSTAPKSSEASSTPNEVKVETASIPSKDNPVTEGLAVESAKAPLRKGPKLMRLNDLEEQLVKGAKKGETNAQNGSESSPTISKEALLKHWSDYLDDKKQRKEAVTDLQAMDFQMEGKSVAIEVGSVTEQQLVVPDLRQFLDNLDEKHGISGLELKFTVVKNEDAEDEPRAYTPDEKHALLVSRNPKLDELAKRLDLDIDY